MLSSAVRTLTMPRERIVSGDSSGEEENRFNYALRPQRFEQYIGQETLIRKLQIAVRAAQGRGEPVEHTLLHGPPGLGKTTLAHVIANEVSAQVHVSNGPALTKPADLVWDPEPHRVLFAAIAARDPGGQREAAEAGVGRCGVDGDCAAEPGNAAHRESADAAGARLRGGGGKGEADAGGDEAGASARGDRRSGVG
jgi:hypothetical protein